MEEFEKEAEIVMKDLERLWRDDKVPQDKQAEAVKLIRSIYVNHITLAECREKELHNIPNREGVKENAAGGLVIAKMQAEKMLREILRESAEEHALLVNSALCLLDYVRDMTVISKAKLYWELRNKK